MSQAAIDSYNRKMVAMSVLYLLLAWLLTTMVGPVGFVLANCCNMLVRVAHSVVVMYNTFGNKEGSPLKGLNPGIKTKNIKRDQHLKFSFP